MADSTLAIDIGGTKIAVGLVGDGGDLGHHAQLPTPDGDAEAIWAVVDTLVTEALAAAGGHVRGVGIASAGPIDLHVGHRQPDQCHAVATLSDRRAGDRIGRCPGAARRRRPVHGDG